MKLEKIELIGQYYRNPERFKNLEINGHLYIYDTDSEKLVIHDESCRCGK